MYFFPCAAPLPIQLVWTGGAVGTMLALSGLVAASVLAALALRAQRGRVVKPAPMIRLVKASTELRRAAA